MIHCSSSLTLRKTAPREAILSCLSAATKPLSIEEIKTLLVKKRVQIDEATIYRTMKTFILKAIVKQIDFQEGKFRYEMANLPHHHHLICEKCGAIENVNIEEKTLVQLLRIKTKFKVMRHSLEFFGLCQQCQ